MFRIKNWGPSFSLYFITTSNNVGKSLSETRMLFENFHVAQNNLAKFFPDGNLHMSVFTNGSNQGPELAQSYP